MQPPRDPQPTGRRAVVVIGGDALCPAAARRGTSADIVIAADSGYDHALAAGLSPQVLVGDLDSITAAGRAHARAAGVEIELHPPDKDATDTEIAVDRALAAVGAGGSLTLLSGGGDRLDHLLAAVAVLARPGVADFADVTAWFGPALVYVAHGPRRVRVGTLRADTTVSLLPFGDVDGVTTSGLRWRLTAEPLPAGTSRGVSNLAAGGAVAVTVERGVLAVVIPDATELPEPTSLAAPTAEPTAAPSAEPTPRPEEPT